jgi:hypothetical protein
LTHQEKRSYKGGIWSSYQEKQQQQLNKQMEPFFPFKSKMEYSGKILIQ